jgi:hypothetical protein
MVVVVVVVGASRPAAERTGMHAPSAQFCELHCIALHCIALLYQLHCIALLYQFV